MKKFFAISAVILGVLSFAPQTRAMVAHFSPKDLSPVLYLDNNVGGGVKSGNAAQFTAANSEYLSIADNAALSMGDIDFTVAGWVYMDSNPASVQMILSHWDAITALSRDYFLGYTGSASDRLEFRVGDGANNTVGQVSANNLGTVNTGTWYFIVAWHDAAGNTVNIQVNDGIANSSATTGAGGDSSTSFKIGAGQEATTNFWDGRIHDVIIAKQIYTAAEKTFLYNGGNGRSFEKLGLAGTDGANINVASGGVAYFKLGEESGTRADSWGANTLTDNATVTLNDGVSLKDPVNNDSVRQVTDLSGNGNNASTTGNVTTKPRYATNVRNGRAGIRFDGTNDILTATNFDSSTSGTVIAVFKLNTTSTGQYLLASSDEATTTAVWNNGVNFDATSTGVYYEQRNSDNIDRIGGGTSITSSTFQIATFQSNGSALSIWLNGTAETLTVRNGDNNGDWVGDTADRDNFSVGAGKTTSNGNFLDGYITSIFYKNSAIPAAERKRLERYYANIYRITY